MSKLIFKIVSGRGSGEISVSIRIFPVEWWYEQWSAVASSDNRDTATLQLRGLWSVLVGLSVYPQKYFEGE